MHVSARGLMGITQVAQRTLPLRFICLLTCAALGAQESRTQMPKVWDDAAIASVDLPLAVAAASPVQISSKYYYGIPVRPIFKSYPVFRPDSEPAGYLEWLKRQEPKMVFDAAKLKTQEDWIRAGELVFDAPIAYDHIGPGAGDLYLRLPDWYRSTGAPVLKDGSLPFYRYVIRQKGKVEIGVLSCGMCHTRVMPDGSALKGAQGNFPFDRAIAWDLENVPFYMVLPVRAFFARRFGLMNFSAPWIHPQADPNIDKLDFKQIVAQLRAIPPGVLGRHGTSSLAPSKVPDLIGIQDRRYLDATGLTQHRDIGDLMRYAAMNQDADLLSRYGNFVSREAVPLLLGKAPADSAKLTAGRYADEQLYALALFLYSLRPPPNPNHEDALASAGRKVFEREGCPVCHTPPLYTNNALTPAIGFRPPAGDAKKFAIVPIVVGTDPTLALKTRRGTGYYKVPSLKGLWYRGPIEHNGSVSSLEDWFDPRRLSDSYTPTGFKPDGVKTKAVKGHEFGLKLPVEERKALIAFLRTL
jgi:hypothetical protein